MWLLSSHPPWIPAPLDLPSGLSHGCFRISTHGLAHSHSLLSFCASLWLLVWILHHCTSSLLPPIPLDKAKCSVLYCWEDDGEGLSLCICSVMWLSDSSCCLLERLWIVIILSLFKLSYKNSTHMIIERERETCTQDRTNNKLRNFSKIAASLLKMYKQSSSPPGCTHVTWSRWCLWSSRVAGRVEQVLAEELLSPLTPETWICYSYLTVLAERIGKHCSFLRYRFPVGEAVCISFYWFDCTASLRIVWPKIKGNLSTFKFIRHPEKTVS